MVVRHCTLSTQTDTSEFIELQQLQLILGWLFFQLRLHQTEHKLPLEG